MSVTGELSTDITFGDATTFGSPYTGLILSGDGWVLSTNLSDGMVNIEEAKYSWNVVEDVLTLTFGSQAEPYGLAWGLHRPSNNWFVSNPRDHMVTNGVGVGLKLVDGPGLGLKFQSIGIQDLHADESLNWGLCAFSTDYFHPLTANRNTIALAFRAKKYAHLGEIFRNSPPAAGKIILLQDFGFPSGNLDNFRMDTLVLKVKSGIVEVPACINETAENFKIPKIRKVTRNADVYNFNAPCS